jgi:hypothetical protein
MKNVAIRLVNHLLIAVHNDHRMTHAEGRACLNAWRNVPVDDRLRILVYTEGGGPSAAQRKDLLDCFDGRTIPTAILSDGAIVRGMATALSWFNKSIRPFPRSKMEEALEYLGVPRTEWDTVRREVACLHRELEDDSPLQLHASV